MNMEKIIKLFYLVVLAPVIIFSIILDVGFLIIISSSDLTFSFIYVIPIVILLLSVFFAIKIRDIKITIDNLKFVLILIPVLILFQFHLLFVQKFYEQMGFSGPPFENISELAKLIKDVIMNFSINSLFFSSIPISIFISKIVENKFLKILTFIGSFVAIGSFMVYIFYVTFILFS